MMGNNATPVIRDLKEQQQKLHRVSEHHRTCTGYHETDAPG